MRTPRARIAGVVASQTLSQGISNDYAREVAAYLLNTGRVGELESLLRDIQADWAQSGYIEVIARSAHPITDTIRNDIADQVRPLFPGAEIVHVTDVIDSSIVGGVQIQLADRQLDLSVEAKLNTFKQLTGAGKD
jgi:F0F1-type ATP synthase delta subunit